MLELGVRAEEEVAADEVAGLDRVAGAGRRRQGDDRGERAHHHAANDRSESGQPPARILDSNLSADVSNVKLSISTPGGIPKIYRSFRTSSRLTAVWGLGTTHWRVAS